MKLDSLTERVVAGIITGITVGILLYYILPPAVETATIRAFQKVMLAGVQEEDLTGVVTFREEV